MKTSSEDSDFNCRKTLHFAELKRTGGFYPIDYTVNFKMAQELPYFKVIQFWIGSITEYLKMRNSLLFSALLGGGLGLAAFGANATPIHVNLAGAGGSHSWTSPVIGDPHGTLNLTGWEYDNAVWTGATMTYKNPSPDETGLGVACNQKPSHNVCGQNEIGTTPWQMIDMNISALTGWSSLTINLGSVNGIGYPRGDETGYLLGASCTVGGACTPIVLASCTNNVEVCSFNFTYKDLLGISNIWVTPSLTNQSGANNGNILLGGDFVLNTVPEPAALGIFGLGILMIGLLVGLRRRQH